MRGLKILLPLAIMGATLYLRAGDNGFANIPQVANTEDIIVSGGLGVITGMIVQSL